MRKMMLIKTIENLSRHL